jgi:plastocyanin
MPFSLLSGAEKVGWACALVMMAVMGTLVAHGPFHDINKPVKAVAAAHFPPVTVTWTNDSKIVAANSPDPVRVHVGQPVVWVNKSSFPHTATARNGSFNSGNVNVGATFRFIPRKPGTYTYYCQYHPLMHGILIVT